MDSDLISLEIMKMQISSQGSNRGVTTADKLINEFFAVKELFEKKLEEKEKSKDNG